MMAYFIELTDTYGGEANYSWVSRFKVYAKSELAALRMFTRETGLAGRLRKVADYGDFARYDVARAALCVFVQSWDDESNAHYLNVKVLGKPTDDQRAAMMREAFAPDGRP